MYANTENYFEHNKNFVSCKSQDVVIRKCDIKHKSGDSMELHT